ncbi:MAG: AMP-binding protein [Microcoleus sp. SIO2G3]|nr:AMP-binding protein [Microcoleus sp. SIO2G3]
MIEGWSWSLLWKEVYSFYEAFCHGKDLDLERPRPYRDYITWLQQQDLSKAEAFWRQQLKGFTTPTPLGVNRVPGSLPSQEQECDRQRILLSATETAALQSFARQHKLTLNILLQGAWALLLSRYSGEDDVVFGATSSGRSTALAGAESIVGLFINTLPLRVRISPDVLLLPWLEQLQAQQLEALHYEYTPLAQIQGWSEIPRNQPLFESILVFNNYFVDSSRAKLSESLRASNYRSFEKTNYPLTVVALPGSELRLEITYNTHQFDAAAISRMLGHLKTLLAGMVANPHQHLRDLSLLTAAEQHQLLFEWNDTQTDYPKHQCIHELFEAQVEQSPDAIAVVFEDRYLTYRQLNDRANQLAHYLQLLGVRPEVLVGICVERSLEMVIGLLGILKAGGAYIPLDPALPQERLKFMLEDSQVSVLLTESDQLAKLLQHQAKVLCLDTIWQTIEKYSDSNPNTGVTPDNLAYTIYTSGSTGKPKGVQVLHQGVVNFLASMSQAPGLCAGDVLLAVTTISFDIAVLELFLPLSVGARVVVVTREVASDATELSKALTSSGATVMQATPATWRMLITAGWQGCSTLKILCGGEALSGDLAAQLLERSASVWNMYGPTETTIWSAVHRVEPGNACVAIGRAIANTQIYLIDPQWQGTRENQNSVSTEGKDDFTRFTSPLVPVGVPGELYIGGIALARGYLNRPELTAEKFIPNPFNNKPEERLYKTGDLARYRPDGSIEYLGRSDHQVKVRGFRIELGEIEAVLSQHPAVREAIVLAREDVQGDQRLVAYVAASQFNPKSRALLKLGGNLPAPRPKIQNPKLQDLRHFLSERLPEYMVPSIFVQLDAIPLTPNGKADRKALPEPDTTRPELDNAFVAPRTPIEAKLVEIWAEILRVERVGIRDNFFELGGDSILSLQIVAKANQAGLKLTPKELFKHPTIANLAAVTVTTEGLDTEQGLVTDSDFPLAKLNQQELDELIAGEQPVEDIYPLSPLQQGLLFHTLCAPKSGIYVSQLSLALHGKLNIPALKQTWQLIVDQHPIFRTAFAWENLEHPLQVVHQQAHLPWQQHDWRELSPIEQQAKLEPLLQSDREQGFILNQAPLMRLTLLQLAEDTYQFIWSFHHLLLDGWSIPLVLQDVFAAYAAISQRQNISLTSRRPYRDYITWLQQQNLSSAEAFWRQLLKGFASPTPLGTNQATQTGTDTERRYDTQTIEISAATTAALQSFTQQHQLTLNTLIQGSWALLLNHYSGEQDVVFGATSSGRPPNLTGAEFMVGLFINTLPVRVQISPQLFLIPWLEQIQAQQIEARQYDYSPLVQVQKWSDIPQGMSLFESLVVFENYPINSSTQKQNKDLAIGNVRFAIANGYPLTLRAVPKGELSLQILYDCCCFDADTITQRLGQLQALLNKIALVPNIRLSELAEILTDVDQQQQRVKERELEAASRPNFKMTKRKAIRGA